MADSIDAKNTADQVAYLLKRASRCYACDKQLAQGEIAKLKHTGEEKEVLCLQCSKLDGLAVLLKGNAKLTRLASKYSQVKLTLLQWSELWKTYERVGLLLESSAIERAKEEITS